MHRKSTVGFPKSYRWSAYITPKSRKGSSKSDFFVLGIFKRVIVTSAVYPRFLNFFPLTFTALGAHWLRRYERKIVGSGRFLKWVGLSANIWQGRGHRPPTTVGVRKLEWLPFPVVSKYLQSII